MSETRKARLPNGNIVTWHFFYVDSDGDPMAVIEEESGRVRSVAAQWITFVDAENASLSKAD